jgi:ribosomal protein S18 acetylase RimI-like enzyme
MEHSKVKIQRADKNLIPSFNACLDAVAREKIYIEMTEAPPLENITAFQMKLIESGQAVAYAVCGPRVVGWCDISVCENPRTRHRGSLGMGLLKEFRGQGIGSRLLAHGLEQAQDYGIEKVELSVYVENVAAVALYEKFGFQREGLIRSYRKFEGRYFDCLIMGRFF